MEAHSLCGSILQNCVPGKAALLLLLQRITLTAQITLQISATQACAMFQGTPGLSLQSFCLFCRGANSTLICKSQGYYLYTSQLYFHCTKLFLHSLLLAPALASQHLTRPFPVNVAAQCTRVTIPS